MSVGLVQRQLHPSGRWFFNMFAVAKKTRRKSCKAAWVGSNMIYPTPWRGRKWVTPFQSKASLSSKMPPAKPPRPACVPIASAFMVLSRCDFNLDQWSRLKSHLRFSSRPRILPVRQWIRLKPVRQPVRQPPRWPLSLAPTMALHCPLENRCLMVLEPVCFHDEQSLIKSSIAIATSIQSSKSNKNSSPHSNQAIGVKVKTINHP